MPGRLILKPQEHRRIAAGHLWVFSNEVARVEGVADAGETVQVLSSRRELLGSAYYNPHTLIAARLYSRRDEALDVDFLGRRLEEALAVRRLACRGREAFRWVNSEGDGLPGLIADLYADVAVVQILTAGMERVRPLIVEQIERTLHPRAIYDRSDAAYRALEGLAPAEGPMRGEPPIPFEISLDGVRMRVDVVRGQKTGLFLDQAENRRRLQALLPPNARVLDCFCYIGTWGLAALAAGAREVTGIDMSAWALEQAEANARLNGWADRCRWVRGDVAEVLQAWAGGAAGGAAQSKFDVVILDPPAFAKSKKHVPAAERAYTAIAASAMRLVVPGGLLAACSCSQHIDAARFDQIIARAARDAQCRCRVLARLGHSPDHPAVPAMPETTYLKGLIVEVRKSGKEG
ncbi:MAG: class I SAM-dependent rRNA methyltransferase [Candidatus Sumerlaeia bacterium]|nr:class I SAM-dependent rRNA methyltransferase [Candidatus Sumerlaeia bacterium]